MLAEVKAKPPAFPEGELSARLQTAAGFVGIPPRPQEAELSSREAKEGAALRADCGDILTWEGLKESRD